MRLLFMLLGVLAAASVAAQDVPAKKKKKPAAQQAGSKAHQKPTKDQIRRFNELQKKQ